MKKHKHFYSSRALLALLAIVILGGGLIFHLFILQVEDRDLYKTMADNNRLRFVAMPPLRGLIYDRNYEPLARNRTIYHLSVIPDMVDDMDAMLAQVGDIVALSDEDVLTFKEKLAARQSFQSIVLKDHLTEAEVARFSVKRHHFSGMDINGSLGRYYPYGKEFFHTVGYLGELDERDQENVDEKNYLNGSRIGKSGVESSYEHLLHGKTGFLQTEVNAEGRTLRSVGIDKPVSGRSIMLTIDKGLQKAAYDALGDAEGAVVALDPRNGEVLALVSKPSLDPNWFARSFDGQTYRKMLDQPGRPFFNRAVTGQYPPGSTIKPIVALAGLQHSITTPHHQMFAGPNFSISKTGRKFRDWKEEGHGWVDLRSSIAQSCDVFFYDLSYRVGVDRLEKAFSQFGLGVVSGIDLTGERPGVVPSRQWKRNAVGERWYPEETLIVGIGQGYFLVTPLQLAVVASTIATRGIQMKPQLLKAIYDPDISRWKFNSPVVMGETVFDEAHWRTVIDSMVDVVHRPNGTAYGIGHDAPYVMAGKTGTAQVFEQGEDRDYDDTTIDKKLKDHALFLSFSPVHNPVIAIAVVVEHGGGGSKHAAPIARRVLDVHFGVTKTVSAANFRTD